VNSVAFRREREATWVELELLVARIEREGLQALPPEDVGRLPVLYRATLSSLSVARAISLDANLLDYLEALAARAYVVTYGAKRSPLEAGARLLGHDFPAAVRAARNKVALSALLMVLGVVTGAVLTAGDPSRFYAFVSEGLAQGRGPSSSTEELRAVLYHRGTAAEMLSAFAMFLFTHNSMVGITCFATGFAAGVPTVLLLFENGLMLGAFAALYADRGLGLEFWAWILPHGVTELLAVVLCGGAGLVLADALLHPGRHTRRRALALQGRSAAVIVIGSVAMFLLAGLVEGIFRQVVQNVPVRLTVALLSAVAWPFYFLVPRRAKAPR
jgi:uncharacterized membrane protein SpoIIM required for sporulation